MKTETENLMMRRLSPWWASLALAVVQNLQFFTQNTPNVRWMEFATRLLIAKKAKMLSTKFINKFWDGMPIP